MPRLRYLLSAQEDLIQIFEYIARQSGSTTTGQRFVKSLREKCRHLASLPGEMGRARPELGPGYRSVAYGNYIIFFRYENDALEIGNILEGHQDIERHFGLDIETDD